MEIRKHETAAGRAGGPDSGRKMCIRDSTAGMAFFRIKPKSAGVRVYWAQELPASMTAAEAQNYNVTAVVERDVYKRQSKHFCKKHEID